MEKQIAEGNITIDIFLNGRELFDNGKQLGKVRGSGPRYYNYYDTVSVNSLKYHSSWDWIMPVIQKIKNTEYGEFWADTYKNWVPIQLLSLDIGATYQAVLSFITFYNKNNGK